MHLPDAVADLVVGSSCLGCARPGRILCPSCRDSLALPPVPSWPTPVPAGLAPPWASGEYADLLRALVVGHKEDRMLALCAPLGALLARSVHAAAADLAGPLVLVPVPSRRSTVRARGYDATYALTRQATRLLRRAGLDATTRRLLVSRGPVLDQSLLGAADRFANLEGTLHCPSTRLRRLARWRAAAGVVVCDDVLTTGATAREAQRALETVGLGVAGVAVVAATRRRRPGAVSLSVDRLSSGGSRD